MVQKMLSLNVTGGLDMTLTEAEEASEIVGQAAGNGVNIWLGTSIDDTLKDEIRCNCCCNWSSPRSC